MIVHYLILSALLFSIGVAGIFLNRKNLITILLSIELIFLACNINFIAFSGNLSDITGQIFVMFTLTIAAAETAVGLAILIVYYRNNQNIEIDTINKLKG